MLKPLDLWPGLRGGQLGKCWCVLTNADSGCLKRARAPDAVTLAELEILVVKPVGCELVS
jgi:hypothetical protein